MRISGIRRVRRPFVATLTVVSMVAATVTVAEPAQATPSPMAAAPAVAGCGSGGAPVMQPTIPKYQAVVDPRLAGAKTVAYDGAQLVVGPGATATPVSIGITPLAESQVPKLDAGMLNVTKGPRRGYRLTPHPFKFQRAVELVVPYDPALVDATEDVNTFYFDELGGCWRPLERVAVDRKRHVVVSRTDHFTDVVNATVTVPEHPEGESFDPTQLKDIKAADPGSGVNLIGAPVPNNMGDARLPYPLEVPPGRGGLQPQLGVHYSSMAGNGWLGMGWDLPTQTIMVDARWGVPRYSAGLETETYQLGSEQLTPVVHRGQLLPRSAEKVFHVRTEAGFGRIIRHGTAPANYSWEVVDKSGTRYLYGGVDSSTLTDAGGNIYLWALREVRDRNGNVMRYHSVRQSDTGVAGGSVPGSNLYLQRITYTGDGATEGRYAVSFVRDRELGEPRRADVLIDGRGGFKRVTADLLRWVDVTLNGGLIRRYEFAYQTGAFFKTLLKSVSQFGEDGALFNTHTFDYYDEIRDSAGEYQAFEPQGWTSPDDNVRNGAVNIVPGAGEAGALNGNSSTSVGGHLYVGFNPGPALIARKSGSIGFKTGFSTGEDKGLLALVDVDGDTLPDKVFADGNGVKYRQNLSKPGGAPRFSEQVKQLQNLPGILREDRDTLTIGAESYLGGIAAQLNYVDTFTSTDRYFSDVNGDGISDLVNGGSVLFGRVGPDGAPIYGVSADTPVPIGSGQVDPDGLLRDFAADRDRRTDSFPLIDSVRRWVAPFDGTVRVTGAVQLLDVPSTGTFAKPDGVRVAIQQEDTELWSQTINAADHTAHQPTGVDAITVQRGQRLYFRVGSRSDGSADQVSWNPDVAYVGVPALTDVNGLEPYHYKASRDFTLGGRTSKVTAPVNGTIHLGGALTKSGVTTDDVTVLITRNGETVFEQTLAGGATGQIPVDQDIQVSQGQDLRWRVRVDSPIDLDRIAWVPTARYTAAEGVDPSRPLVVEAPYDVDMYPVDDLTAPQGSYTAPSSGTLFVQPSLTFSGEPDGRVVFTVKRRGALLGKHVIDVVDGQVPDQPGLVVPVDAGDEVFFDFSTSDRQLASSLTSKTVTADGAAVPSAFHSAAEEGAFPQPYRGWGAIGYNGNRDRAGQPIAQADLVANDDFRNQVPDEVDPQRDKDEFAADPRITPPKVFTFTPSPAENRWRAGELSWVARDSVSSSRLGGGSVGLPAAADFAGVTAVPRVSRSQQISLTGGIGGPVGSVGGSIATGDSTGELDYIDMNGDNFPDVVGAGGIQYTDMIGTLGATRGGLPDGGVRQSHNEVGNANAGSAARTITTGRGDAAPPGHTSANTSEAGNDLPPLGVGGSLGTGTSDGRFDLLDINGDNLPDRVYENGRAALNLGYRFAAAEPWPGGSLNDGSTSNTGVNIGFETDFYGFGGGASFSQGKSKTENSLMDLNGDGLMDRVFDGSPVRVALNTGNGFAAPVPFHGSLSGINADSNASLGGGGYFTFGPCFLAGCIVINPGADVSTGASRAEKALRDVNGDGYVDHLASGNDNELTVAQNRTGRTNLLKSVQRPLGARIDLEYTRDGNTYDQPQSRWVLSRVAVHDGQPGDGQDVQLSTFRYSGGVYNRLERDFFGYATVVEEHRDPGAADAIYRTVTHEFHNDSYYTRGLLRREVTRDAEGRPFTETVHTYLLRDVGTGTTPANAKSTTATIFPQLVRTDQRFFEGQAQPGKSTHTRMEYDEFGNLTRSYDAADVSTSDDVDTRTGYTASDPACRANNIVGIPNSMDVRGINGRIVRQRQSTIDCATGKVIQHRAFLADGTVSVTDLAYFANGNIKTVTGPANKKGQRYKLTYEYDPVVATHVASVTDSFGYRSSSTYNLKYAQVETSTDFNRQVMRYAYDTVGRIDSVAGPYEIAENTVTIDFEYHPEAQVPYAVSRHIDRNADGSVKPDTIDTVTFVDGLQRPVQTKKDASLHTGPDTPPADAMTVSGRVVYDFLGRTSEQYYPTSEPKGPGNLTFNPAYDAVQPTRNTFDVLDRTTRTVLADNTATATSFGFGSDRAGATQFETAVTDANGIEKRSYADVRELTTAVREFNVKGDQPEIWTSYGYDFLGQLVRAVDNHDNVTTSTYDNFGRRTSIDNPDSGRVETVYDLADNPVKKITANLAAQLKAVEYDYDFNRISRVRYPLFTANNVEYEYGPPGAAKNAAARITEIDDAAGTVEREYGPLGETVKEKRVAAGRSYTTQYRFDSWNRVLRMTFPDGEVLSYKYNGGGMVESATGVKGRDVYPYLKRLDYDKFDQRTLLDAGNGTRTRYTYDAADRRLQNMTATQPQGNAFQNVDYQYDDVGNVTSIENDTQIPGDSSYPEPSIGGPSKQTFAYDDLYQLTSATGEYKHRADKTNKYTYQVSYDAIHNIRAKSQRHEIVDAEGNVYEQKRTSYSHQYDHNSAQPHAPSKVGPDTMRYDVNGNLVDRGAGYERRQLVWDEDNRLACTEDDEAATLPQGPESCYGADVRFVYDHQGNRVVKDADKTHVYPNQSFTQSGHTQFKHIFVGSTRLASKIVDYGYEDEQFFYHADHLGSTAFGTDHKGRLAEHTAYFPSGETWVSENPSEEIPYRFSGKEFDPETGFYYFGSRYYDPRSSIWQSPDPAIGNYLPEDGQSSQDLPGRGGVYNTSNVNLYGYAHQNPVRYQDPSGAFVEEVPTTRPPARTIPVGPKVTPPRVPPRAPGWLGVLALALWMYQNPPAHTVETPDDPPVPEVLSRPQPNSSTTTTTEQRERRFFYVTYTKFNPDTNQVYAGRASGYGFTPEDVVRGRDLRHEYEGKRSSAQGWRAAVLDQFVPGTYQWSWVNRQRHFPYQAIRGREQQLIDFFGGAANDPTPWGTLDPAGRTSGNDIRGVRKNHEYGLRFHNAANTAFGVELHPYTGFRWGQW